MNEVGRATAMDIPRLLQDTVDGQGYRVAWNEVRHDLENGRLPSLGKDIRTGERKPIPDYQWPDLSPEFIDPRELFVVTGVTTLGLSLPLNREEIFTGGPAFSKVKVRRDDVLELWPPEKSPDEQQPADLQDSKLSAPTTVHRGELKQLYKKRIESLIEQGVRSSEKDDLEFLRTHSPKFDRERARTWRRETVPAEWTKGGRPRGAS